MDSSTRVVRARGAAGTRGCPSGSPSSSGYTNVQDAVLETQDQFPPRETAEQTAVTPPSSPTRPSPNLSGSVHTQDTTGERQEQALPWDNDKLYDRTPPSSPHTPGPTSPASENVHVFYDATYLPGSSFLPVSVADIIISETASSGSGADEESAYKIPWQLDAGFRPWDDVLNCTSITEDSTTEEILDDFEQLFWDMVMKIGGERSRWRDRHQLDCRLRTPESLHEDSKELK